MGAAESHLNKLDKIQLSAQKIGSFDVESLQCRKDAAAFSLALKLLDGKCRGELNEFVPKLIEPLRLCKKRTRNSLEGVQIAPKAKAKSLDVYKRGFHGALPKIWSKIPIDIITKGEHKGWLKIKSDCVDFLTGTSTTKIHKKQKTSELYKCFKIWLENSQS